MVDVVLGSDGVYELDVQGYLCPFPVLKASKVLVGLKVGDCLRVLSTDAGSWDDFVHFSGEGSCELVERFQSDSGILKFLLRKLV